MRLDKASLQVLLQLFENNNSDNIRSTTEEEIEELLEARGFKSDLLRLRGYTSYGYRDRSRDVLYAVDIWDLELRIIPKDKRFRNYIIYDYKDSVVSVLGATLINT